MAANWVAVLRQPASASGTSSVARWRYRVAGHTRVCDVTIPDREPFAAASYPVEVLPAVIPSVIAVVQAWVARGSGKIVKFKGNGIEFEGSPEELKKLLEKLEKRRKKK